jgi:hypothetical protein
MIVYGDHPEVVRVADHVEGLAQLRLAVLALPPGIARHAGLVTLFVEVGRLVQGIADARFEARGEDGWDEDVDRLLRHAGVLGHLVIASWEAGLDGGGAVPVLPVVAEPPGTITLKQPEGYAFYALYPESYAIAARRLQLRGPARVIGIRSIGTALSALVAAALDAPPPITVRPVGHPFDRRLAVNSGMLVEPDAHYVVVDEGPGLSGSSFAAVAQFLEARGVPRDRIAFLPSHAGEPASDACRKLWREVQRASVAFEVLLPTDRLGSWIETLVGRLEAPLENLSGGAWRTVAGQADWPADPPREPLKYLARAGGRRWLVKFAGIGRVGQRKLDRAERLAAAGLVPAPAGLVHGFIVQPWVEARAGATPTVAQVAHYLAARRRVLPVPPPQRGASLAALFDMARINIGEALGEAAVAAYQRDFAPGDLRASAMAIDGRMECAEWLQLPDGTVLKADALDHDADHDLIGPQDIAWDVAGAVLELGLDEAALVAALARAGVTVDAGLLRFLKPCYLAYRIGHADRAAQSAGSDRDYAAQLAWLAGYRHLLSATLHSSGAAEAVPSRAQLRRGSGAARAAE